MNRKLKIDYNALMDLRIDFAFKSLFAKGDPASLISLLHAIFENKKIQRVIKTLKIKNPYLEKETSNDKLSILDIRAELEDGTNILIEMHMHGLGELKPKTIRSWARAYGEDLEMGEKFKSQPPTITIAFIDGQVKTLNSANTDIHKIHRLCMITDVEDGAVFTDAMELHYIDMRAFAKAVNETGSITVNDTEEILFSKWLSVIAQKEIVNKEIIASAVQEEEAIYMAVTALARQSEDKLIRQAYQRRKDEIYFYNKEQASYKQQLAEKDMLLSERDAENAELRLQLEQLQAQIARK